MKIQLYNGVKDNVGTAIELEAAIHTITGPSNVQGINTVRKAYQELQYLKAKFADEIIDKDIVAKQQCLYEEAKKKLPAVTWSGTFSKRNAKNLIEYTGLMCLDIDKLKDEGELQAIWFKLSTDPHTHILFTSPTGNGIKVIFKTDATPERHKEYFLAVEKYFNEKYQVQIDPSGKDINRLCFLSSDKKLYRNDKNKIFTLEAVDSVATISDESKATLSKISTKEKRSIETSGQEVNDIYESTLQYMPYTDGRRNDFVFKFACNCNRVGISEFDCLDFSQGFAIDLKPDEIKATVKSAYTHNSNEHGKFKKRNNKPTSTTTRSNIPASSGAANTRTNGNNAANSSSQGNEPEYIFWREYKTVKGKGKAKYEVIRYELRRVDFCNFLYSQGLHLYSTGDREGFQIVHSENGIIKPLTPQQVKHFALDWCKKYNLVEVEEMLRKGQKNYFAMNELDSLPYKEVTITVDNADESYFYFTNCWVKVTKEGDVTPYPYDDGINSFIWEANKIMHEFKEVKNSIYKGDHVLPQKEINCEFARFVSLVSWNPDSEEEKNFGADLITERFESICSCIGFLLDGYKHPANRKGIFAIDHQIGERGEQNGRTGKSILPQACNLLKKVATINGKRFDPKYQFALEPITIDSQIVNFNDMGRAFDPETIFEVIADDYSVNCRNTGFVHFKYNSSPKVYVSSNHIPKGEGGSYTGRMHIIEFSDYFKPTYTPYDEFGHGLFGDWDTEEKQRFYNFMLWCVSLYKTQGLIDYPKPNYDKRKLINEVVPEFIDFMDDPNFVTINTRHEKIMLLNVFNEKMYFPLYGSKLKPHTFAKWVKQYCKQKGFQFNPHKNGSFDKSNSMEYYTIADKNYKAQQISLL